MINSYNAALDPYISSVIHLSGYDTDFANERNGLAPSYISDITRVSSPTPPYGSDWADNAASIFLSFFAYNDPSSNYYHLPNDFTVEWTTALDVWGGRSLGYWNDGGDQRSWKIHADAAGGGGFPNRLHFARSTDGTAGGAADIVTIDRDHLGAALVTGTTYRFAFGRKTDTWRGYCNGAVIATATNSGNPADTAIAQLTVLGATSEQQNARIDELRITKGVERYQGAYIVL